jgi:hypothetical protein
MHISIYVYVYVNTYIYMYICIYIYTHKYYLLPKKMITAEHINMVILYILHTYSRGPNFSISCIERNTLDVFMAIPDMKKNLKN